MRTLNTERFGTLTFGPERVIDFPVGLPGFEGETQFLLIESESTRPLVFLQSALSPALCFTMLPVHLVAPGYQLRITAHDKDILGDPGKEMSCFGILCASDGTAPTVNLLGPIVIDSARRVGVQAVRDDAAYSAQHELFPADQGDEKCL